MAHILINAVSAKSGGAATYVLNLVRQLADKELPHRFVIYVPAALAKELSEVGDRLSVVGTMIGSVSWWRRLLWGASCGSSPLRFLGLRSCRGANPLNWLRPV